MDDKPDSKIPLPTTPPIASPFAKPLFMNPEAAQSVGYVENPDDIVPQFDRELLTPEYEGIREEPQGKGYSQTLSPAEEMRGIRERYRAIARLHALGLTNNQICRRLGYSPAGVSLALQKPQVQAEVERYRTQLYENDVLNALKDLGSDAVKVLTNVLNGSGKTSEQLDAAKWLLEKLHGKAKQEVNVESNTLAGFMGLLKDMQRSGEVLHNSNAPQREVLDVTPAKPEHSSQQLIPVASKWENWSEKNL